MTFRKKAKKLDNFNKKSKWRAYKKNTWVDENMREFHQGQLIVEYFGIFWLFQCFKKKNSWGIYIMCRWSQETKQRKKKLKNPLGFFQVALKKWLLIKNFFINIIKIINNNSLKVNYS